MSSPVACSLTDGELRERREGVLARISAAVLERRELSDGFAYRFAPTMQILAQLVELIELERKCCRFLRFRLSVDPEDGPVWLELTGPTGTRQLLSELLTCHLTPGYVRGVAEACASGPA